MPENPNIRVTLRDIAQAAGVSLMTVSRALRGQTGVSTGERRRIEKISENLGYRPDPIVSRLMSHLRGSRVSSVEPIAWITSHATAEGWKTNPVVWTTYQGAKQRAEHLGYRLAEFWLNRTEMTPKRLSKILFNQGLRGVIVAQLPEPDVFSGFEWQRFASVCCGLSLQAPSLHRVTSNIFQGHLRLWDALKALGYQRIGLSLPQGHDLRVNHAWQGSLAVAQAEIPASDRVPALIASHYTPETFESWFDAVHPDVVISVRPTDQWILAKGLKFPHGCGFVDINGLDPQTAALNRHQFEMGAAAVDFVVGELAIGQIGIPDIPKNIQLECSWRSGPTVRPPP